MEYILPVSTVFFVVWVLLTFRNHYMRLKFLEGRVDTHLWTADVLEIESMETRLNGRIDRFHEQFVEHYKGAPGSGRVPHGIPATDWPNTQPASVRHETLQPGKVYWTEKQDPKTWGGPPAGGRYPIGSGIGTSTKLSQGFIFEVYPEKGNSLLGIIACNHLKQDQEVVND